MATYAKVMTKRIVRVQVDRGAHVIEFDVEGLEEAQKIIVALTQPEAFGVFALAKSLAELGINENEPQWTDLPAPTRCSCGWTGDDETPTGKIDLVLDEDTVKMSVEEIAAEVDRAKRVNERADKHVARALASQRYTGSEAGCYK